MLIILCGVLTSSGLWGTPLHRRHGIISITLQALLMVRVTILILRVSVRLFERIKKKGYVEESAAQEESRVFTFNHKTESNRRLPATRSKGLLSASDASSTICEQETGGIARKRVSRPKLTNVHR